MLGLTFKASKTAESSAVAVRDLLGRLEIASTIDSMARGMNMDTSVYEHNRTNMARYIEDFQQPPYDMSPIDATNAALASYMFGAATADGAILRLLEHITGADKQGADKVITHWCSAHRLSGFRALPLLRRLSRRLCRWTLRPEP